MRITKIMAAGAVALALAGCGDTFEEKALVGGAAGAGAAVLLDTNPVLGGLLGAGANVAYCERFPERC